MLEGFVGTPVFQAGVNSFIKKYAYQNAVTAQLWAELTTAWNAAGVEVSLHVGGLQKQVSIATGMLDRVFLILLVPVEVMLNHYFGHQLLYSIQ